MAETLTPDLCIVGAGPGSHAAAVLAGALRAPCVFVDRGGAGERLEGARAANALIAAAGSAWNARRAGLFGVEAEGFAVDFDEVRRHVRDTLAAAAPDTSPARLRAMGVSVVCDPARFADARTLEAGALRIRARRFVIATGSQTAVPDIAGLSALPVLTCETLADLAELPAHLLVIGAGPQGLELAQAFCRFGSRVTVVSRGRALARFDPEIAGHVVAQLRREGVVVHEDAEIVEAGLAGAGVRLEIRAGDGKATLEGSHVLAAEGRSPAVADLGLEAAGIAFDAQGIRVSATLRTSNRRVYAVGGCVGGEENTEHFVHAAGDQAVLAVRNALFRTRASYDAAAVPRTVFTDPEIAMVGLTEEQARGRNRDVVTLRFPFSENDRARVERLTGGEIKIICTRREKILGAAICGPRAGELIAPWALAMRKGLGVADMRDLVLPYPTLSEVSKRAALSFYTPQLRRPALARLIRLLRLLG